MGRFSKTELAYLSGELGQPPLARLATIDSAGMPHVVPTGWSYNAELDTIDIGGHNFAATRKFRNVRGNPNVAVVIDEVLPPWRPRAIQIRGTGEALEAGQLGDADPPEAIIRVRPTTVVSWGLHED